MLVDLHVQLWRLRKNSNRWNQRNQVIQINHIENDKNQQINWSESAMT
jgi:hypothetical protein